MEADPVDAGRHGERVPAVRAGDRPADDDGGVVAGVVAPGPHLDAGGRAGVGSEEPAGDGALVGERHRPRGGARREREGRQGPADVAVEHHLDRVGTSRCGQRVGPGVVRGGLGHDVAPGTGGVQRADETDHRVAHAGTGRRLHPTDEAGVRGEGDVAAGERRAVGHDHPRRRRPGAGAGEVLAPVVARGVLEREHVPPGVDLHLVAAGGVGARRGDGHEVVAAALQHPDVHPCQRSRRASHGALDPGTDHLEPDVAADERPGDDDRRRGADGRGARAEGGAVAVRREAQPVGPVGQEQPVPAVGGGGGLVEHDPLAVAQHRGAHARLGQCGTRRGGDGAADAGARPGCQDRVAREHVGVADRDRARRRDRGGVVPELAEQLVGALDLQTVVAGDDRRGPAAGGVGRDPVGDDPAGLAGDDAGRVHDDVGAHRCAVGACDPAADREGGREVDAADVSAALADEERVVDDAARPRAVAAGADLHPVGARRERHAEHAVGTGPVARDLVARRIERDHVGVLHGLARRVAHQSAGRGQHGEVGVEHDRGRAEVDRRGVGASGLVGPELGPVPGVAGEPEAVAPGGQAHRPATLGVAGDGLLLAPQTGGGVADEHRDLGAAHGRAPGRDPA